jgi:hypothetical protein
MVVMMNQVCTAEPSDLAVPCGYSAQDVGNVAAAMVLMGIIGSAIFGKVLEKKAQVPRGVLPGFALWLSDDKVPDTGLTRSRE